MCAVMLVLYGDHSRYEVGHLIATWWTYLFKGHVKCMYTSCPGHTFDCSELVCSTYTNTLVLYLDVKQLASMEYMWHLTAIYICCCHIYGNGMVNKSCSFYFYFLTCICGDVEFICGLVVQWDIYMQWGMHICSGVYASNVKCMYTSVSDHSVDCI